MKKKEYGICRVCRDYKKLSFEHVPPRSSYNNKPVKLFTIENFLAGITEGSKPWEINNARWNIQQKGKGGYYSCKECNNKTGSWYVNDYKLFTNLLMSVLLESIDNDCIAVHCKLREIKPLSVFKQIVVMFCNINEGLSNEDGIRDFILDKNNRCFDSKKYRIALHLTKGPLEKSYSFVVAGSDYNKIKTVSEISSIPIGLVLYKNYYGEQLPDGMDISCFLK